MQIDAYMTHPLWGLTDATLSLLDSKQASSELPYRNWSLGDRSSTRDALRFLSGCQVPTLAKYLGASAMNTVHEAVEAVYRASTDATFDRSAVLAHLEEALNPFESAQRRSASTRERDRRASQLDSREAELQAKLDALSSRVHEAADRQTVLEESTARITASQSEAFSRAEADRAAKHSDAMAEASATVLGSVGELRQKASEDLAALSEQLETAKALLKKVEKVAGRTTEGSIANRHGRYSSWQSSAGYLAYAIGFASLFIGAWVLWQSMDDAKGLNESHWVWFATKLSFGALLGAAATVAFRVGGRFFVSAATARRLQLELNAIEPFLATFDEARVQEVKIAYLERTFGQKEVLTPTKKETETDPETVTHDFMEALTALIKKLTN